MILSLGWQRPVLILSSSAQGPFTNYVDKILPIIDHLPTPVDIWDEITLLLLHTVDISYMSHLPTSFCQRSLWLPLASAFRLWRKK